MDGYHSGHIPGALANYPKYLPQLLVMIKTSLRCNFLTDFTLQGDFWKVQSHWVYTSIGMRRPISQADKTVILLGFHFPYPAVFAGQSHQACSFG